MHAKLTQAVATSSEPSTRDYDVVDTVIPGFVLRVRVSGAKSLMYRYRNKEGRRYRYLIGRFPGLEATAARRQVFALAAAVAAGSGIQSEKRASRREGQRKRFNTLETFLSEQYEPWASAHLKTSGFQLARIKADFGGLAEKASYGPEYLAGSPVPPCWHWLYFLSLTKQSEIGPDGNERRGGFLQDRRRSEQGWGFSAALGRASRLHRGHGCDSGLGLIPKRHS